jgi:pyruvyltransferase
MKDLPLVSFCLFTYNQEQFIGEAIEGAFSQDYDNLEIIISDDSSTDSTWDIIQEKAKNYSGKHKLIINRNIPNLGLAAHTNKLYYELSHGKYVAIAAGDDISLPQRIRKSVDFLEKNTDVVALSTSLEVIDQNSDLHAKQREDTLEDKIFGLDHYLSPEYKHINGPSRIVSRTLIEAFPPLQNQCPTEDTTILLRAFMFGKVAILKEKLVRYRLHDSNLSSAEGLRKMNLENIFEQNYSDISYSINKYINESQFKSLISNVNSIKVKRLKISTLKIKKSLSRRVFYKIAKKITDKKLLNYWFTNRRSLNDLFSQYLSSKKAEKEVIKLGGSTWSNNYGDALNIHLIKCLVNTNYYESYFFKDNKEELLMVGSILHRLHESSIVWGSGLIKEGMLLNTKPKRVYAVRGPLTRKELLKNNIECPEVYGDPALLTPFLYKPKNDIKKYKYGLLPHYIDKYHPFVKEFSKRDDTLLIDIEGNYNKWTDLIDLMLSCENILTSSLHGVIISDSYQIPNVWIKATDGVTGNGFKFRDYYLSVNKDHKFPLDINVDKDTKQINSCLSQWTKIDFDYRKLLNSFPYQNLLNKMILNDLL